MVTGTKICTICARGGSKGVPGKNARLLNGQPLLSHSVRQAHESGLFECVLVTSDAPDLLDLAQEAGADELVLRPAELASDRAPKVPAIQHAVQEVERRRGTTYGTVVDLDVTSPLRTVEDVRAAVRLFEESGASNVFSVTPGRRSPWFNMVTLDEHGGPALVVHSDVKRRQDAPVVYDMNASIYVWSRAALKEGIVISRSARVYEMPGERSFDVDEESDWLVVTALAAVRPDLGGRPYRNSHNEYHG